MQLFRDEVRPLLGVDPDPAVPVAVYQGFMRGAEPRLLVDQRLQGMPGYLEGFVRVEDVAGDVVEIGEVDRGRVSLVAGLAAF